MLEMNDLKWRSRNPIKEVNTGHSWNLIHPA
jgi:hypothetical protein